MYYNTLGDNMEKLDLEIYFNKKWCNLGHVEVNEIKKSFYSATKFEYNLEYYFENTELDGLLGLCSVSCLLPLSVINSKKNAWPSFLLDLMPQGHARQIVCNREKIVNSQENDFEILRKGAVNPIGNIRVKNEHNLFAGINPVAFSKADLINKNELFLEHAASMGAFVVGTSGAQGVAPKFLVNTNSRMEWFCDGALKDEDIHKSYLCKMARGKSDEDRLILRSEKIYMDIAHDFGVNVFAALEHENGILFIPRFDRYDEIRYGIESLSSVHGDTEYGQIHYHEDYMATISKYSTEKSDLLEYINRDLLNISFGNTDNHGRNTAFIKYDQNTIRLSPLYDFAPMVIDSSLITRVTKWKKEKGYIPDFMDVSLVLKQYFNEKEVKVFLLSSLEKLRSIESLVMKHNLEKEVVQRAMRNHYPLLEALTFFVKENYND
jgi:serine/threonine-protein kinase HipA